MCIRDRVAGEPCAYCSSLSSRIKRRKGENHGAGQISCSWLSKHDGGCLHQRLGPAGAFIYSTADKRFVVAAAAKPFLCAALLSEHPTSTSSCSPTTCTARPRTSSKKRVNAPVQHVALASARWMPGRDPAYRCRLRAHFQGSRQVDAGC